MFRTRLIAVHDNLEASKLFTAFISSSLRAEITSFLKGLSTVALIFLTAVRPWDRVSPGVKSDYLSLEEGGRFRLRTFATMENVVACGELKQYRLDRLIPSHNSYHMHLFQAAITPPGIELELLPVNILQTDPVNVNSALECIQAGKGRVLCDRSKFGWRGVECNGNDLRILRVARAKQNTRRQDGALERSG